MKATFLNEPEMRMRGNEWEMISPFNVNIRMPDGAETLVTVETGFVTDIDSVPRLLFPFYALLKGRARRSAVLHDWLYFKGYDRKFADNAMLAAMAHETNSIFRTLIWAAVRVGGGAYYSARDQSDPLAP